MKTVLKGFILKPRELVGCVLIAIGIQCIAHQAVEDYKDERIWSEAAEAEEKVEDKLRRETDQL